MHHWDLNTLEVAPRQPQILHSDRGQSRSILIALPAGDLLQEHQVHERTHLMVIEGEVEIGSGGETLSGSAGTLLVFDPAERHEVRARSDARLLLVLAPWPGDGHPGARD